MLGFVDDLYEETVGVADDIVDAAKSLAEKET